MPVITAAPAPTTERRSDDGITAWDARRVDVYVPDDITGAVSQSLPGGRVMTVLIQSTREAGALAAAKIARGSSDLYAADAKPAAGTVADALVAAGLGGS